MITDINELLDIVLGNKPKFNYHQYLKSEKWKNKREKKLKQAEYHCQICYSPRMLQVHHRTYARIGNEKLSDLVVLCKGCHNLFHKHRKLAKW